MASKEPRRPSRAEVIIGEMEQECASALASLMQESRTRSPELPPEVREIQARAMVSGWLTASLHLCGILAEQDGRVNAHHIARATESLCRRFKVRAVTIHKPAADHSRIDG